MPETISKQLKVLLVDDHALLRGGLRQLVLQQSNLTLVGEATNGAEAVKLAVELTPDVVVMDILLPDFNGIEASRKILSEQVGTKIIVFSSNVSRSMVDEALQAGVCGYVSKSGAADELIHAIASVMTGKLYLSSDVSADILKDYRTNLSHGTPPPKPLLSDREKHLLRLIAAGQRNKEIAGELDLSIKSVEAARSRLMKKLGCASSAELVRYSIREGISTP